MIDVIVLAAGLGRRLAGVTSLPKWLSPIGPTCPAHVHLPAFERAGVRRVHIVTTGVSEAIEREVAPWRGRLDIRLIPNSHAADRNNWYSLLLGLEAFEADGGSQVVVLNSDLFAPVSWFSALLGSIPRTGRPAALAVDRARGRTDEAMKVALDPSATSVQAVGKRDIANPGGEYVGMAWWTASAADELRAVLEGFLEVPANADHWYEHAIQVHLSSGGDYGVVDVPSGSWVEIDDERDLEDARALLPDG